MTLNVGTEVSTEYIDESDYVSSEERNTPFPSLTLSKKFELERYLNNGVIVSTFSNQNIEEPKIDKRLASQDLRETKFPEPESQENSQQQENNSCCLLL